MRVNVSGGGGADALHLLNVYVDIVLLLQPLLINVNVSGGGGADALRAAVGVDVDGGGGVLHVPGARSRLQDVLRALHPQVQSCWMG